jgi:AraC-like DNA-binding protein
MAAPIYDPSGEQLASFEVATGDDDVSEGSPRVLRTLIDSAARAIAERLFRIHYRRHWILAARRDDRPETYLVLALNSDLRVLGADRHARQMLNAHGCDPEREVGVSALFRIDLAHLPARKYSDETLRIRQREGDASWSAVLTPPDTNPLASAKGERAVAHTRPRLDTILGAEPVPPEPLETLGLPPRMLRRMVDYIDTHLDSELTTEGLAAILKVSASHFARSFTASVGLTPHAYVMGRRLSRAQELLAETQLPLVEIALCTGFADQSHFCRRFHQLVGVPPRTFRKQLLHS